MRETETSPGLWQFSVEVISGGEPMSNSPRDVAGA
jgi:hypothetical protein